ncbi:MAG: carbamoyltransferase HypF [Candidatus Eremiobacteraeota bacterium]|nr:carbamoyltransferase HypF [Candidatus Eremiobacteraeota bacterium]
MQPVLEIYGTAACPYTADLRDDLAWTAREFAEYDVESDPQAMARMVALTGGNRTVPVLVEDGRVLQIGVNGRGCFVNAPVKLARLLHVSGVVQGVGFRPFVYRIAHEHAVDGWVLNGESGVVIHAEGAAAALDRFVAAIRDRPPPAARIAEISVLAAPVEGFASFTIRESEKRNAPTVRVSPDLPVCEDCLREMRDPADRRFGYPYINCTNCGPRYSIVLGLPYDRPNTTMASWPMCDACTKEYRDPGDRRFHAQPIACAVCGPTYVLGEMRGSDAIARAASMLRDGAVVAIKGLGGYHVACNARDPAAVAAIRERKFRKERPFAVMAASLAQARVLAELSEMDAALLESTPRPIVLAPSRELLEGVAPDNREIGIMLPYTPVQHLLFAAGAPPALVMTSGNRSSEPIAYTEEDACNRLAGIADVILIGERAIARRIDDSVARTGRGGPAILRHARGYAPRYVAALPALRPILALGADLKNAIALAIEGRVLVSQHIGDLAHFSAFEAFKQTVTDVCAMYEISEKDLLVAHDAHPQYASTLYAADLLGTRIAVQHHRAHAASVLAERGEWDRNVIAVTFDGTGYGDDGTIWGGEIFTGSLRSGLERALHLRGALLPGGDAAARYPVQCAAGFVSGLEGLPDLEAAPFAFSSRYRTACELIARDVRCFRTTSVGRLFDAVAALCGFTREITFEGQAAMWLEQIAANATAAAAYSLPLVGGELDFRPMLRAIIADRVDRREVAEIARGFHVALADAVCNAANSLGNEPVVASGGVFQNRLLTGLLEDRLGARLWLNTNVPCNDGGICLGQAAIASLAAL